mgnify:CR=1 FL=1|jgi:hypothetical protein
MHRENPWSDAPKVWDVEFWPGQVVRVRGDDEHDAICAALYESEYPGGFEQTGHGALAKIWVREVKQSPTEQFAEGASNG